LNILILVSRFRWVSCQLEALRKCLTAGAIRRILDTLPATLDETYDRLLIEILDEHRHIAVSALTWLTVSERPLTLAELAEACVIDGSKNPAFDPAERLLTSNIILNILSSLVSTQGENDSEVRLAHFSVKEYLTSDRIARGPAAAFRITGEDGNDLILQNCIHYMHCLAVHGSEVRVNSRGSTASPQNPSTYEDYDPGSSTSEPEIPQNSPLFSYASHYWMKHLEYFEDNLSLVARKIVVSFLLSPKAVSLWMKQHPFFDCPSAPALYIAAYFGLSSTVEDLLRTGIDVNEQSSGTKYGSALHVACERGHAKFVSKLLAAHADVNLRGGSFGNALRAATYVGNEGIIQELLLAGAKVDATGESDLAVLNTRSCNRNPGVIILLLSHGASIKRDRELGGPILHWAATAGHVTLVEAILANLSDPQLADDYKWTTPDWSWTQHGVWATDISPAYFPRTSAPYEAIRHGHIEVAKVFFSTWSEIDEIDYEGRTALYWATFNGRTDIMKLLLHHGADLHCPGPFGWTAKYWARWKANSEQVALLESMCGCDICSSDMWANDGG
jgi:ankyrin repeat protein